ncbi:hypothetical protein MLD52_04480 [Puniceicoccaceae bacterium K14]|nr:hypothetical protein [Puniceicoccaceae bacterium K14]
MNLLTDCSVSPKTGYGIGGYIFLQDFDTPLEHLNNSIQLKKFSNVTSTELELKTLLWALAELKGSAINCIIYTDSQNITRLPGRRARLEENGFKNSSGRDLKLRDAYLSFFKQMDGLKFEVNKVKGHSPNHHKNQLEKVFSLIDKKTRKSLRELKE